MYPIENAKYSKLRGLLESGDMMVVKNPGLVSWGTLTEATHIGMILWRKADQNSLSVAESREFKGSRVVSFSSQVRAFPGMIDVYRPKVDCHPILRERAATVAYNWAGHSYGYPGIGMQLVDRMPIVRFLAERLMGYNPDRSSMVLSRWESSKYCSQLYAWAYRLAKYELGIFGSWEPCPGINDRFITPGNLTHSGAFDLIATNVKP